jgi:plasmid stability protein
MRTLEIANLPDELYQQIEKLARVKGRSVSELAADMLAKGLAEDSDAEAALMAEIRAGREVMANRGVWITDEDIRVAKNWGRE